MQKSGKYILFGAAFAVSLGAAFLLTKTLKNDKDVAVEAPTEQFAEEVDSIAPEEELAVVEQPAVSDKKEQAEVKNKETEEPKIKPMTASEFQHKLLNFGDMSILGGRNPQVAKSVSIHINGGGSTDIQSVRDKIKNEIWKSVSVTNVGHDNKGRINSVTINVVKNEDDL